MNSLMAARLCAIRSDSHPLISSKKPLRQRIDTNIERRVQIRRICPFALFANLIWIENCEFLTVTNHESRIVRSHHYAWFFTKVFRIYRPLIFRFVKWSERLFEKPILICDIEFNKQSSISCCTSRIEKHEFPFLCNIEWVLFNAHAHIIARTMNIILFFSEI